MFKKILADTKKHSKLPEKVKKKLHLGPRMASSRYNRKEYGYF